MKKIIVLYHKDCPDGFGAAWTARRKFGNKADYISVEHQLPPPSDLKDKDIYFTDFCYPAEITGKILKDNKSLTVIDHHATAKNITESVPDHLYGDNHSGAILTWKYFNGSAKPPILLRYVEDADLWKFKLPHAKDIMAFMETVPYDFKVWDKLVEDFENNERRRIYIHIGELISRYQEKIIDKVVNDGKKVVFNGYQAMAVNSPILTSEVGHAIVSKGYSIGIIWSGKNNSVRVSLRGNGRVDVAKLAVKYGGGGHKSAAAFRLKTLNNFPWKAKK